MLKLSVFLFLALCSQVLFSDEPKGLYEIKVQNENNKSESLEKYKGKAILIVNVASRCGFTKQYSALQKLYLKYQKEGLVILAFPCNDFGKQEPGTLAEIKTFCESKFSVTFPIYEKIKLKGKEISPLYQKLISYEKDSGKVKWNFEKFLINRKGETVGRYRSRVKPSDEKLLKAIEKALKTES